MRDIISNTQVVHLGNLTLAGTTPVTSAYVDLSGFGACTVYVVNNTITDAGTAAGFTATLQESETTLAAGAASVDSDATVGGVATVVVTSDAASNTVAGGIGYSGDKQYVGISVTGTAGTSADVSIIAVMGKPSRAPIGAVGVSVART